MSARQVVLRAYERALHTRHPMDWLGVEYAVSLHLGHRAYVHLIRVGLASYLRYLLAAESQLRQLGPEQLTPLCRQTAA